ncbi:hypothetical protein ACOME3_005102 [Neoechinorhynchus agilis]
MAFRHRPRHGRNRNYDYDDMEDDDRGGCQNNGRRRGYRQRLDYFVPMRFGYRRNDRDSMDEGWFRAVLPGVTAEDLSKSQLCSMLNDRSSIPITVYHYQQDEMSNRIIFFINSRSEAQEIKAMSRRFSVQNRNVQIFVSRVPEPTFAMTDELQDVLRRYLSSRYNEDACILSLASISRNESFRSEGIYLNLSRSNVFASLMTLCEESFPNTVILDLSGNGLSSLDVLRGRLPHVSRLNLEQNRIHRLRELDYVRHMQLIELSIGENPLCRQFSSFDDLTSAVRDKCPKLNILNGTNLPPRIGFAIDDEPVTLPQSVSFNVPETFRDVIAQFINEYFRFFDSGREERQPLMNIYTDDAVLSFAVNCGSRSFRFDRYIKEGRNFIKVVEDLSRHDRLKRGRFDIVSFFVKFPKTTHDPESLKVDLFACTSDRISFSITGLFLEESSELSSVSVPATAVGAAGNGSSNERPNLVRQFFRVFHCMIMDKAQKTFKVFVEHFTVSEASQAQVKQAKFPAPATPLPSTNQQLTVQTSVSIAISGSLKK